MIDDPASADPSGSSLLLARPVHHEGRKPTYCHAAIDHEHLTKDVARFGGAQPNGRGGDFAWLVVVDLRAGR